jgi:hypothetical protein
MSKRKKISINGGKAYLDCRVGGYFNSTLTIGGRAYRNACAKVGTDSIYTDDGSVIEVEDGYKVFFINGTDWGEPNGF